MDAHREWRIAHKLLGYSCRTLCSALPTGIRAPALAAVLLPLCGPECVHAEIFLHWTVSVWRRRLDERLV